MQPGWRYGILAADLLHRAQGGFAAERWPAGEHLVEDCPEGVDIGGRTDFTRLAEGLLRSHVTRCPERGSGRGLADFAIEQLGQAEVGDLGNQSVVHSL